METEAIRLCIQKNHGTEDYTEARKELNALLDQLAALRARVASLSWARWVNVTDRLPENMDDILICDEGAVQRGYYRIREKVFLTYEDGGRIARDVSHWMPLPPAPEQAP